MTTWLVKNGAGTILDSCESSEDAKNKASELNSAYQSDEYYAEPFTSRDWFKPRMVTE